MSELPEPDYPAYLRALTADGNTLLTAVRSSPKAPVTSCPGWDTTDLAAHVGSLWHYVSRQAGTAEQLDFVGRPPEGADPVQFAAEALDALLATLTDTDPQASSWNWARNEPNTAAFWFQRMAQETVVHRWDAESAAGEPGPIDSWLAADGIEEFVRMWLPRRRGRAKEDIAGTAHLHLSDPADGQPYEWFLELGPGGKVSYRHAHEKGDAVVRGRAQDVLLRLWGRPATVEEFGDAAVLTALRAE